MDGQMTFEEVQKNRFYDRNGHVMSCPEWVDEERCGNCKYWQILDVYQQPPCGWQVRGLCGSHRGRNQYTTAQTSYCDDYEEKSVWDG